MALPPDVDLHEPGGACAFDLAGRFLADVAGRPEPWPALLAEWGADRGVSPELQAEIRAAVETSRPRPRGAA